MGAFFSNFDWQHSVLLGGAILGGVLIGVGILKESEEWSTAAILVLIGVIIEPIVTIGLFVYDESLSREQQSTIERQQADIIRLTTPRNLSPSGVQRVAAEVCPFGAQPFQITSVTLDEILLRNEFDQIFKQCSWNSRVDSGADTDSLIASLSGLRGIRLGYSPERAAQFKEVSEAFAAALKKEGIEARAEPIPPAEIPKINVIEIQIGQRP